MTDKPRHKKVRVPTVAVGVQVLETRLDVAVAQGLSPNQMAAADGVRRLLRRAEEAAYGIDPSPGPVSRWWSGALVDAANQNLHAARAQMIDVYDDAEIAAEIPSALNRMQQTMHRDEVRRRMADSGITSDVIARQRAFLRRAIEDSYDALDRQYERLRSFRNIILLLALCIAVLVAITIVVVWTNPVFMPLCFPSDGLAADGSSTLNCPTGEGFGVPHGNDIVVVALLGLLGGALAAAVSIRNLRGTSTPYDVPVALSLLKVPLGAFTAIVGLVAIQGDFVPGLSALDSQQQILAYALVLGYGQQVFTYTLDRRAQTLLDGLPSKDGSAAGGGGGDGLSTVPATSYRLDTVVPTQTASTGNGAGPKPPADDEDADSVTLPKAKATGHQS
jgi:hypothetical protein